MCIYIYIYTLPLQIFQLEREKNEAELKEKESWKQERGTIAHTEWVRHKSTEERAKKKAEDQKFALHEEASNQVSIQINVVLWANHGKAKIILHNTCMNHVVTCGQSEQFDWSVRFIILLMSLLGALMNLELYGAI